MRKIRGLIYEYYPLILILVLSVLLIMPQMRNRSIIFGADAHFHFNRLYDNYMQLKTHNFSIFQSNFGFFQSGRIINAVYGPGFAWLLSLILYLVHSWAKFQIVTSFLIYVFSGIFMYLLAQRINTNKKYATIASLLFISSYWITSWSYVESYMSWGTMLMPLVIIMGINMIEFDKKGLSILSLSLIIAAMFQIHVLSFLLSILTLIPFFIIGLIKNKDKKGLLKKVLIAAGIAIILTINVWLPLLEVYSSNSIISVTPTANMAKMAVVLTLHETEFLEIGFAFSSLAIFTAIYFIVNRKKIQLTDKTLIIIGLVFLVLSTKLLPWKFIGQHVTSLQSTFQFPYRFLTMATVLLIPVGCKMLSNITFKKNLTNRVFSVFIILATTLSCFQTYQYINKRAKIWNTNKVISTQTKVRKSETFNPKKYRSEMKSNDLGKGLNEVTKAFLDYLPNHSGKDIYKTHNPYKLYIDEILHNQDGFKKRVVKDKLIISWYSHNNQQKRIPVFVYHNSKVIVNGKYYAHNNLQLSDLSVPKVKSKVGYNELTISYRSRLVTPNLLIFVLLMWIGMIVVLILKYIKKLK